MRKELICNVYGATENRTKEISFKKAANAIGRYFLASKPVLKLARLYSLLLEEEVSPRRALRILNASAAITLLVCVNGASTSALLILTLWTIAACRSCRKRD